MSTTGSQNPPRPSSGPSTAPSDVGVRADRTTGAGGASSPATGPGAGPTRRGLRVLNGLTALLLLLGLYDMWAGPRSAFHLMSIRAEAAEAKERVADLERQASLLIFEARARRADPVVAERVLAERRGVAAKGGRVVVVDDSDAN